MASNAAVSCAASRDARSSSRRALVLTYGVKNRSGGRANLAAHAGIVGQLQLIFQLNNLLLLLVHGGLQLAAHPLQVGNVAVLL